MLQQNKPNLPDMKFPAMFGCADAASNGKQKEFLWLIRAEYGLLFLSAILSLNLSEQRWFFAMYGLVLIATLGVMFYRTSQKPEQHWYKNRALAESVKTSTWRYVMHAEPFGDPDPAKAKDDFRQYLSEVLKANQDSGALSADIENARRHTTAEMETVRALGWVQRRDYYLAQRINDQLEWYRKKAGFNIRQSFKWQLIGIGIYASAIVTVFVRITEPSLAPIWPIEPLLVAASFVIGWTQIKKFNELNSVYSLTAHEVQLIHEKIEEIDQELELPKFVNEAELAFSREHTQWVARQANKY